MPLKTRLAQFESSIAFMMPLPSSKLGIVTAEHEIFFYNILTDTKEKILHLNVPKHSEFLYAFDSKHMRLVFGSKESNVLHIVDLNQKKLLNRFELDQQSPTAIAFSPDGSHFVCGTDQGRVLLWRYDTNTLVSRLHSFPEYSSLYTKPKINFVSALAFHNNLLASSGYGGNIVVTNYRSQTHTQRFHPGPMKNQAIVFYKDALISGNQDGVLLKISRNKKFPNQRVSTSLGPIVHLLNVGSTPYVLAASQQRSLTLINIETMKVFKERYIELESPITWVCKDADEHLFVGTQNGELYEFDLQPITQLDALIDSNAYVEAYRFCEEEPLLRESESYRVLESIFDNAMEKAKYALEKGNIDQAKEFLEPFKSVKSKDIAPLLNAFTYIERLKFLFDSRKFSPFYGLVESTPLLQTTTFYKQTEKIWTERFTKAQKLVLLGKIKEAQKELEPFASVNSKRPMIQLLLHHSDVLKTYSKAIHERDYHLLNHLTQQYSILRKLPSYTQLINEAGELENAIIEAFKNQAFDQASLLLHELGNIVQYEETYTQLKKFSTQASNLNHAITHQQWRSAYHILDSYPELMILPWAQELEYKWQEKLLLCEKYAVRGDIVSIKTTLENLMNLPERYERIGNILRMAYQIQLKVLQSKKQTTFSSGVVNYCKLFGVDTEIRHLLKKAKKENLATELDPSQLHLQKRDEWLHNLQSLPDHIV
ncbi:WD40 repeat domain-containing protein [Sulfuricurvum sp.]|uniref:WD40 repeat domain-containing protein n=3 Tax=Sulfuricurvum sp. TaxID=2025608 RepID=UPI0026185A76|nr:WD40 repeat domain-containing protein [Sulfuricurvum sp.]MDD2267169.1 WD40 repeat domain-containing protein [Sulfuricurvum sp.]